MEEILINKQPVLIDSNILIAFYADDDSLHAKAASLLQEYEFRIKHLNTLLFSEICSVILQKTKHIQHTAALAKNMLHKKIWGVKVFPNTMPLVEKTLAIFCSQPGAHLSFPDCSVIAQARMEKIHTILTFDKALRKLFADEFEFLPKKF